MLPVPPSVPIAPISTMVTRIPNGLPSPAKASLSPSRPHFAALVRPRRALEQVRTLLRRGGCPDPAHAAELLLAPVFYRWFLRLPAMSDAELGIHVSRVLRATAEAG